MLMRYCDTPARGLWRDKLLPNGSLVQAAAPALSFYHIMVDELIRVAPALE
jgi:mannose/cellobiose epimerase-like protein (N-acyl-D-glucosamine 2-epimerase family)